MNAGRAAFEAAFARRLEARAAANLTRAPVATTGVDFLSNDYFGWAHHPDIAAAAADAARRCGAGGRASRLLGGDDPLFASCEARLAALSHSEAALLFSSGYAAWTGVLPAILGPDDEVFSDALNHASIIDGLRLCRARRTVYPHGDVHALADALDRSRAARKLVITESVFSMDGDTAALSDLTAVAERRGAAVAVDEAHATGLYGPGGAGLAAAAGVHDTLLFRVHTGGKALGAGGGWVAGSRPLIALLTAEARSFVYSTAPAPAVVGALAAAVDRLAERPPEPAAVHAAAQALRSALAATGADVRGTGPIVPVILGESARALAVAKRLQAAGFAAAAVRPPTVPAGTTRLRLVAHADHDADTIQRFTAAFAAALAEHPP